MVEQDVKIPLPRKKNKIWNVKSLSCRFCSNSATLAIVVMSSISIVLVDGVKIYIMIVIPTPIVVV